MDSKHRSNEYFYVIDNTEYPEALDDPQWKKPEAPLLDGSKDVYITIHNVVNYTSNDKYYAWTVVYIMILSGLGFLLMIALGTYMRMIYVYNSHATQRKVVKQEMFRIKSNEYERFLMQEN